MSKIFYYWADTKEPTHCDLCSKPLHHFRWRVTVNGIRRTCCTEAHAKQLVREWDLQPSLNLGSNDEIPFLEQVEKPPLIPPKEPGALPQDSDGE